MPANSDNVGIAMGLVIGAGAATGIGGAVVFFPSLVRLASRKTLAAALGMSSGVMVYVSFAEILIKSQGAFEDAGFDEEHSKIYATLCFFGGVVFMILLNYAVTFLLGGHHHHHDGIHDGKHAAHSNTRRETTSEKQDEQGNNRDDDDDDAASDATSLPPCPCHDDNPIETLERVKSMAESMHAHPNRAHPHGKHTHHHNHNAAPIESIDTISDPNNDKTPVTAEDTLESSEAGEPHHFGDNDHIIVANVTQSAAIPTEKLADEGGGASSSSSNDGNEEDDDAKSKQKLVQMSLNTALAIGIHNFPEGLATFVAALNDPKVGGVLAVAIAIHNIPEGLCVSMPVYYATGNRWKAFQWSLLSGMAEPVAGLLGWAILAQSFSDQLYGVLFGIVAGMMVIISVRELLPTAHRYDPEDSVVTYSFCSGMVIMAVSLMLFMIN